MSSFPRRWLGTPVFERNDRRLLMLPERASEKTRLFYPYRVGLKIYG